MEKSKIKFVIELEQYPKALNNDPLLFPQIRPDFAAAIGYVTHNWTFIEDSLSYFIAEVLNLRYRGSVIVTSELSSLARIEMIYALLYESRHQEWLDLWNEILPELTRVRSARNEIVHSSWLAVGDGHMQHYRKTRRRIITRMEKINTDQLLLLADEIMDVASRINRELFPIIGDISRELAQEYSSLQPLIPNQGRSARAQAQARETKQARRSADRKRSARMDGENAKHPNLRDESS